MTPRAITIRDGGLTLAAAASVALSLGACGGSASSPASSGTTKARSASSSSASSSSSSSTTVARAAPPSYPRLSRAALASGPSGFVPAVMYRGRPATWIARSPSSRETLLSFDQRLVKLILHSGTIDAGATGWRWGPSIAGGERRRLVAAFNGAFKLATNSGGFMAFGRTAAPLRAGLASIVTYADGYTDIGSWREELPQAGRAVASVRQNLTLLIDHGAPAATLGCLSCWGATLGGVDDPARSGLGVTAHGRLIWAGGEHLTVTQLADALLAARVVRAVELDINPEWVAGYLYEHRGIRGPVTAVPVLAEQPGVSGQFLAPYGRDFFTVLTR